MIAERSLTPTPARRGDFLVSVVLPLYNEARVLRRLAVAVAEALEGCRCRFEIIFVNDGSHDESALVLDQLAARDPRIHVLHLSRNFGHQAAVQAGLLHARGDAVVLMDSDMQDDPACLADFIRHWQAGYDVVYAVRVHRKESWVKRTLFFGFYRLLNLIATSPIPNDAGIFSLIDRHVAERIANMPEYDRFFAGLRHWIGYRQIGVAVRRGARHDDKPRVSLFQLFQLAKTAIFSFSRVPLSMFYAIAGVSLLVCLVCISFTLYHKLITGRAIPGWTSITIAASFFGALNALGIGILGEYVVRIYDQVRGRPKFIVQRSVNFPGGEQIDPDGTVEELIEFEPMFGNRTQSAF